MKFFKYLLHLLLIFGFFFVIASCSQKMTMQDVIDSDEPCWVTGSSNCDIEKEDNYIYVVGQAMKQQSKSRPGRMAFLSAESSAKTQYASSLGEMIKTRAEEYLTAAGDEIEGSLAIGAMKEHTERISSELAKGLRRHDQYFISTAKNKAGIPLWDVWVRMRVEKKKMSKKFDMLESDLQKKAAKGVEGAVLTHKAIKKVQDSIKEDDFFEGF